MTKQNQNPVIAGLNDILADTYTLMVKTHTYHWNVEGIEFSSLHALFDGQYNELFAAADAVAERIRALGEKVPGSLRQFAAAGSIDDTNRATTPTDMIKELLHGHETLAKNSGTLIDEAEKADDAVTADLMTSRKAAHDKTAWMLRSLLK